ncbi:hypothetical protein Taro_031179 [Colocasia esculenta]|uniref:A-kinase anchor protein 7-like phosphoesterase domain-containing protein n=1 Tax=Colocasia esculenta TaxID=4460 RepID=A0A843VTY6_COLES|nr:hypothetical protein [Colocasia esculenta]
MLPSPPPPVTPGENSEQRALRSPVSTVGTGVAVSCRQPARDQSSFWVCRCPRAGRSLGGSKDSKHKHVRSPNLEFSHFISLPLAIHPALVERLYAFQNSILGSPSSSQDRNLEIDLQDNYSNAGYGEQKQSEDAVVAVKLNIEDVKHVKVGAGSRTTKKYTPKQLNTSFLSDLRIDRSIFMKPEKVHLTVLMLKLWNKESVLAATELLQKISSRIVEALESRPISIRLKGLECMKGYPAKARVLYAPLEEIGGEGRLLRACRIQNSFVIIEAYIEAGLVTEEDIRRPLKFQVSHGIQAAASPCLQTLKYGKANFREGRGMAYDYFDARSILERYGSEDWGEYLIREAHLSKMSAYGESRYYDCCASIPFPGE